MTKSEKFNPEYEKIGKIPLKIEPKPIMLVEGWMVLWHPEVRKFLDFAIYLDATHDLRMQRRTKIISHKKATIHCGFGSVTI